MLCSFVNLHQNITVSYICYAHCGIYFDIIISLSQPGHIAQSVVRLTQEPELENRARYPVRSHTFVSLSTESRMAVVSYWRKYVHEVLVNR